MHVNLHIIYARFELMQNYCGNYHRPFDVHGVHRENDTPCTYLRIQLGLLRASSRFGVAGVIIST